MGIDFYYVPGSSPCRTVLLAAKALGVNLNKNLIDMATGEHLKPEFLKINPQHTVPTMVDNGFALSESRAIITYLANKYGKDDSLYPKDPQARALVDQRLYFDIGTLYQTFGDYAYPQIFAGAPADPAKLEKLKTALGFFDTFLEGQTWAAGKNLTLADLSLVASISTIEISGIDISKYANIMRWYANCKKNVAGYDELNESGVQAFKALIEHYKKK